MREVLEIWGRDDLERVAELLTSELVTNVVMHAMTDVAVELSLDESQLRVAIADRSPVAPAVRDLSTGPGGFGLRLIDQLAQAWGVEPTESGKTVWFALERDGCAQLIA